MARAGRLAGAIIVETEGNYFLVGNTKMPCDWTTAGFVSPGQLDTVKNPFVRLTPTRPIDFASFPSPHILVTTEGEACAATLAQRFLIERNGSVSDRLWRLVVQPEGEDAPLPLPQVEARWLTEMPEPIWNIVRETVLRCL